MNSIPPCREVNSSLSLDGDVGELDVAVRANVKLAVQVARSTHRNERGSGTVLMMSVMIITAMVAFVTACLLSWFGCAHQTRTAADLAALAGAGAFDAGSDACAAAGSTATSNHTAMTACNVDTNGVDVVIRVTVQMDAKPAVVFGPRTFNYTSEAGHIG